MKKLLPGSIFILTLMLSNLSWAQNNSMTSSPKAQEWTLVETQKNVEISFSKMNVNGVFYLAIQMENKSDQAIDLTWSVSKNGTELAPNASNKIAGGSTITLFDATRLIAIGENESFDAYTVHIR